ncbi:MAG: InlB B-repeat-containing protein [Clostridiales bacterium]|nr:InlB B-repeat-containing protein [Clostridiales bacterium]
MYGDVSFTALWTANDYTVTFDLNDSSRVGDAECATESMTVTYDSAVGTLPVPTLTAYEFDGWYTDVTYAAQITEDTIWTIASSTILYAKWTPVTYTASFDPDGGILVDPIEYNIETTFTFPVDTRIGYSFTVWNEDENDGNWVDGATYEANATSPANMYGNVTFLAIWDANTYTLTFNLNDSTGIGEAECSTATKSVTYDSEVGELPIPTRTGYTFDGWFTAVDGGEEYTEDTVYTVADGLTLYAHWTAIEYTITFSTTGDAIADVKYTIETDITLPAATRTGYTFNYYINTAGTSGSWKKNTTYLASDLNVGTGNWGDVTLNANFTINEYTITWVIGDTTEEVTYKYGNTPSHADPTYDDACYYYTFKGWNPTITTVTGDQEYIAVFDTTPKYYTATWIDGDGNPVHEESIAYGAAIPEKSTPEVYGYTVTWDAPDTMPADDLTIYAVYTPVEFEITWNIEGTTETSYAAYGTVPAYTGATELVKAEDECYTYEFLSWTPELTEVTGEATYTAVFEGTPKEYTITWMSGYDNDQVVRVDTVAYGSAITDVPSVIKVTDYAGQWADIPDTMPAENITIITEYTYGGRTVTWVVDSNSYETTVIDGNTPSYPYSTPTKTATAEYSYTFAGWSDTEDGEVLATLPEVNGADVTYYAIFTSEANEYTVTWIADGEEVDSATVAYGEAIPTDVAVPDKTGYTGEWDTTLTTMPAEDLTIYAAYTPISYTITWVIDGVEYTSQADFDSIPVCPYSTDKASSSTTDYTFTGWDTEVTAVTGEATYTAHYSESPRVYTITWVVDGVPYGTYNLAYGGDIPELAVPEKEGYDGAWNTTLTTMPASDLTITAEYTIKTYTITWSMPTGDVTETYEYDSTPGYLGTPTKASTAEYTYTFSGWDPTPVAVTESATYTAQFTSTARTYTVTYMADGNLVTTLEVAYGSAIPQPEVPSKTGYTGSWNITYSTMPAQNITVNATYKVNTYYIYWQVDGTTVYLESYNYGSEITAPDVPEKAGYTGVWQTYPETMPAYHLTIAAQYTANTYNVTWRVGEESGADTATYNVDYTMTFATAEIPTDIRVVVDGSTLSTSYYTYDAATGTVTITGSAILGDVTIISKSTGETVNVAVEISGGTTSNSSTSATLGNAYHTEITADAGYLLPDSITVYIDGIVLTSGYTYDSKTGKLTINGEAMTGELQISVTCPVDPDYVEDDGSDTDDDDTTSTGGLFGSLYDLFMRIINFLRRIFGISE